MPVLLPNTGCLLFVLGHYYGESLALLILPKSIQDIPGLNIYVTLMSFYSFIHLLIDSTSIYFLPSIC
jgi:hypothetical protein